MVDRLLRGRAWIWLIGIMLGGIVAMQVSLLKLNSGISHSVETAGALERVNADLETEVARLSSGERIQLAAADEGMVAPPAGDVGYLTARPGTDPRLAAERMQSPSADAREVMASGGRAPADARARHRDRPRSPTRRRSRRPRRRRPRRPPRSRRSPRPRPRPRPRRPPRRSRSRPPPRAPAPRQPPRAEMKLIERRIGLLFAVFLLLLVIGAGKAAWLGVVKAGTLKQAAATQQEADLVVPARRGAITDRTGTELAVSQPAMTIAATPYLVKDPARLAAQLAGLLDKPEDEILRQLARRDTGFVYVARHVPAARARKVQALKVEGMEFIPEFTRVYPREWMASQLLGSVGTDNQGLSGLEYSQDKFLKGADGERRLKKDALGEAIEMTEVKPTEPGQDLRLTLDANIQDKAEEVLADVGEEWKPKGATAIVMDPRDGAVLALANWPRVNANQPGDAPDYARQNRAIGATYEPGSTFKAFTVAGALEQKEVTADTEFNLPPTIMVADREIGESHPRGYVTLTTRQILEQSSNVGAITIGQRLGSKDFDKWVRRFGFGQTTGIDLPGEEQGIVLPLERYSGSSMGNLPIGQGIAVTPMQMATAYSAIANGGVLRPAHMIESVGGRPARKPEGHRVISEATASSLRQMLEGVLGPGGTASGAAIPGYLLAGKTGTAEKPDPITGGYSESKYVSSFVGFAPAKRPKLLVAVMVDEPQGEIYGGLVAGPAFRDITSFALNYLKIPPDPE